MEVAKMVKKNNKTNQGISLENYVIIFQTQINSIKQSATLKFKLFFMRCNFVYPLRVLTCHCHSSSIQTCQRCSHSRRASTACSSGTREPVDRGRREEDV